MADWAPVTPPAAATLLNGYPGRWWVAGGWSIDLFLGRQTRPHADIDIAVLRCEQHLLRAHFAGWDIRVAHEGELTQWIAGDRLVTPQHQFWARPDAQAKWTLEFLLEDNEGGDWLYRRDAGVRLPLAQIGRMDAGGVPYLCPEVSLLYKAKGAEIERNAMDFEAALPKLGTAQRTWLRKALGRAHPEHAWIARLAS
jgi:hypothetical protein